MIDFWDIAPLSLVEADRQFWGACCLHHQSDDSETSVYFNETTQRYIPESCNLHSRLRENLKSYEWGGDCEWRVMEHFVFCLKVLSQDFLGGTEENLTDDTQPPDRVSHSRPLK
jgi:hypothetical protein